MYLNNIDVNDVFTAKQQNAVTTVIANDIRNVYGVTRSAIDSATKDAMSSSTVIIGGVNITSLEARVAKIEAEMTLMDINMRMHQTELEELTKSIKLIKESSILGKVVRLEPDKEEE